MTLETIKTVAEECIAYIEQNAVWLGIVGVAVLILLLLFGFLASAGRSRKQRRMLRKIDEKMARMLEEQEKGMKAREEIAADVAAIRATGETTPGCEESTYADTVGSFFADTQVEICEQMSEEEQSAVEQPVEEADAEQPTEEAEAEQPAEEAKPVPVNEESAAEISLESFREALREGKAEMPAESAVPAGPAARGKSGRLYTREELEHQIRK